MTAQKKRTTPLMRALLLAGLIPALAIADEPIGEKGAGELPLFDAHVHYKEPAWGPYPPEVVMQLFDKNGVAMALVSSTPDQGTIKLWEHSKTRIVPELRPYFDKWGSSTWMEFEGMEGYITDRLARYPHEGIGEFHIRNIDAADKGLLQKIADMALAGDIPIHIHSGAKPVEFLFELEPKLTVIWAHAGMSEDTDVIGPLMDKYERLFADTSYRESDILSLEALDPAWEALLKRHSDRFMVGSDTWVNGQWADYDGIIDHNRAWLALLPRDVAEKIAFKNAEKLFGRKVSKGLIGTR